MAKSAVWKACQRRLYSWLSSKCGLPVCVVGILLATISALQFGEVGLLKNLVTVYLTLLASLDSQVFLEWSKERYTVQFSIYADNVAGKSYEDK